MKRVGGCGAATRELAARWWNRERSVSFRVNARCENSSKICRLHYRAAANGRESINDGTTVRNRSIPRAARIEICKRPYEYSAPRARLYSPFRVFTFHFFPMQNRLCLPRLLPSDRASLSPFRPSCRLVQRLLDRVRSLHRSARIIGQFLRKGQTHVERSRDLADPRSRFSRFSLIAVSLFPPLSLSLSLPAAAVVLGCSASRGVGPARERLKFKFNLRARRTGNSGLAMD